MSASLPLTVLVLEPHLASVAWLRQYVCDGLGGDLMMADSVAAMKGAIDTRTPDLLLLGPGTSALDEAEARRLLHSSREARGTEFVRLGRTPGSGPATGSGKLGGWLRSAGRSTGDKDCALVARRRITVAIERIRGARERRQHEDLAARLQASTTAATAVTVPTRTVAVPAQPECGPAPAGPARPDGTRCTPARRAAAAPVGGENEWGLFDPDRCGAEALAAAIDRVPVHPDDGMVERSPADLLLEFGPAAQAATALPVARADEVNAEPRDDRPADSRTAACPMPRSRPFPLALWAHLADCCHAAQHGPGALLRYTEAVAGVATLALGLHLPPQVAAVAYASGCRIHRIRVVNSTVPETGSAASWAGVAVAGGPGTTGLTPPAVR